MKKVYLHEQYDWRKTSSGEWEQFKVPMLYTYCSKNNNANTYSDRWLNADDPVSGEFQVYCFGTGRAGYMWVLLLKDNILYRMTDDRFVDLLRRTTLVDGRFTATLRWYTAGGKYYLEKSE